ncbi:embryonic protein UVS.2-like [Discoglossus pictus]
MIQGDVAIKRTRNVQNCPRKSCLWPKAGSDLVQVAYTLSTNFTRGESEIIRAAMEEVMVLTCIRFVARSTESNYLRIRPQDGCWSYIGRVGGAQDVSLMKPGCLHRGIIQHELLHSLGFQHEQCRSDRDKYIRINWGNISQDKERNFYKMSTQNLGAPYDYLSVLHYGKFAFANEAGKPTLEPTGNPSALIGQRIGLSALDVVKINRLYQCNICSLLLPDPHGGFSWDSRLHPNTSTCMWLIRVPEGQVFLQFESFAVQSSPGCAVFTRVYDGLSAGSPLLHPKTCGGALPPGLVSSGTLLRVELVTNGIGSNFKARYDSVKCGATLTGPAGNFTTPGFPNNYPNSMDCVWSLSAPPGNKASYKTFAYFQIILCVAPFTLESSPGCSYDYFLVREGRSQKKRCGVSPRLDITSSGRSLLVHFHSDSSVQAAGFQATYTLVPTS